MAKEHDGWDTGSGLLDEWEGKIVDAVFQVDANFREGNQPRLVLEWQLESGPQIIKLGTGDGWVIKDDGARIEHETKDELNKNSKLGRWVTSAAKVGRDVLQKRGTSLEAGVWKGLIVGAEREENSFTDKDTGEKVEFETFKCVSIKDGGGVSKEEAGANTEALKARVQAIWDASEDKDWGLFVQQVFSEVPEVLNNKEVEDWVSDEAVWGLK